MTTTNTLLASLRPVGGKGPARRLRAEGKIPAVAYGADIAATALAVSPKELKRLLSSEHGLNTVVELEVDGKIKMHTLVVDYQVHPVTRALLHADFKKIDLDKPVDVEVTLELVGKSVGVTMGGELNQIFKKLPVRCRPAQIPVKLVHDITEIALDQAAHVKELKLPEGVEVLLPPERTIATVHTAKKRKDEEEATTEAAAAAPAGASKAPPAKEESKEK
jgi:large subunit ribosomal protein L25